MPNYHIHSHCCFTPSERPYIYSVDMMKAYVNLFRHPIVKINVDEFLPQLKENLWGSFSPMDVIRNPHKKEYAAHYKRIVDADLSYPLFVSGEHNIIDGAHRLCKAILTDKKTVNAYVFNKTLMKKFVIHEGFTADNKIDEAGADKKELYEVIMMFHKRFC